MIRQKPSVLGLLGTFVAAAAAGTVILATAAAAASSDIATGSELPIWAAVVLGLVEGLTEYLPVSSTGHLVVVTKLLGLADTPSEETALDTYAICIQIGAIAAVLLLYRARITQMIEGLFGRSEPGRRVLIGVIAAFVPTAIIGLVAEDAIRSYLFGVTPIAFAWLVGGIAILALTRSGIMERGGKALDEITLRQAVIIGLAQSIAMWPGVSRSLVTIVAGVLIGLSLAAAVEFAFLLGLVTLSAATVYAGLEGGGDLIDQFGWISPLVGMVVAFVSAVASIRWMVSWLQERGLNIFGWYRIAIGLFTFLALGMGWITN